MLRPAVGQVDRVGTLLKKHHLKHFYSQHLNIFTHSIACTVARLGSLEIGCGVVVSNCIVVSVGGDFVGVDLCRSICRSWVGKNRCCMNQGGNTMGNTMMANKSMMADNTVVTYCMWVGQDPMSSAMQSIGMVSNGSDGGTKGFRLGCSSMFSLERLRD